MAVFPVRKLGSAGIVTDMHPSDIESAGVFTSGVNVRFKNGKVTRGPVARTLAVLNHEPGHALCIPASGGGADEIITVAADFGSMIRVNGPSSLEDVSPPGQAGIAGNHVITSSFLGGVAYLNRETHEPLFKGATDTTFLPLPNWPENYKASVIRAYKDQLIALGVSKNGQKYPTMVKWSDFAYFGAPPESWDPTSTTNSAGENIINEMQHRIVDGMTLRDSFIIYCTESVWLMDYIGGNDIYGFRKLFDESGVINANCVVQVGGQHFVFDQNDIYVHDGVSPRSIADDKVKDFIFGSIDYARTHLCFVAHDAKLTEIRFFYPSDDQLVGFYNPTTGCNRAAVFNYGNGTWTFYDVPNVTGHTRSALIYGANWESDQDITWADTSGIYSSSEGDEARHTMLIGRSDLSQGLTQPRLYGFDLLTGGRLLQPPEPEALRPAFLERTGLDLDELGKNLAQYTHLQAIWPQMSVQSPQDCYWQFGASELVVDEPLWSEEMVFDPKVESKLDINEAGKYLAYRFGCRGSEDFSLSGFDVQLVIRGRR